MIRVQKHKGGIILGIALQGLLIQHILAGNIVILLLRLKVLEFEAAHSVGHCILDLLLGFFVILCVAVSLNKEHAFVVFDGRKADLGFPSFADHIRVKGPYIGPSAKISLAPLDPLTVVLDQRIRKRKVRRSVGDIADDQLVGAAALSRVYKFHSVAALVYFNQLAVISGRPSVLTLILFSGKVGGHCSVYELRRVFLFREFFRSFPLCGFFRLCCFRCFCCLYILCFTACCG